MRTTPARAVFPDHLQPARTKRESFSGEELGAYDESAAKQLLESGLRALGETPGGVRPMRYNDPRKVLACLNKRNTMAGDEWIKRELDMGHRSNVSRAVSAFRSESSRTVKRLKLQNCTYARTDPLRTDPLLPRMF
jgi:hypothetical protein